MLLRFCVLSFLLGNLDFGFIALNPPIPDGTVAVTQEDPRVLFFAAIRRHVHMYCPGPAEIPEKNVLVRLEPDQDVSGWMRASFRLEDLNVMCTSGACYKGDGERHGGLHIRSIAPRRPSVLAPE